LPVLVLGFAAATSRSTLETFFLRDDFGDLFEFANFGQREWLVAPAAGRMYLVRNSIYYLNFLAFWMNSLGSPPAGASAPPPPWPWRCRVLAVAFRPAVLRAPRVLIVLFAVPLGVLIAMALM